MRGLLQPDKKQVGNRIRTLKDELGVSLTDLGNRLGLSKSTINSYVQGYSLAPQEIIEHLAQISKKPALWFYFGDPDEYIRDYLILKGHGELLVDFPNIPANIENDFLVKRRQNPGQFKSVYPEEDLLDLWFTAYYHEVMKQYITDITVEFVAHNTQLEGNQKDEAIALIAREIYDSFDAISPFGYGDRQQIENFAKGIYENNVHDQGIHGSGIDFEDQYLVGTMINLLGDYDKTTELIKILSKKLTEKGFSPSFGGEKLVAIFQSMRPALIDLYTETTSDEFYDWFGE